MKNLVPESKTQISALRMEDEVDAEERKKKHLKAMNATTLN